MFYFAVYGEGSLTGDKNRGIAKIDYDACGYPRRVQYMDGSVTEYVYSAAGAKLRAVHRTAVPAISVAFGQTHTLTAAETLSADSTDYLGNLVMTGGKPEMYLFDGGYCSFDAAGRAVFHYYDRDHLGNVRAVVGDDGAVEQVMNYYPFGAPYCDETAFNADLQPYKYNGKELETMHGRNAYDYGARFYDPLLPTWDRMDPLCEKYYHVSPYAYCLDNPVKFLDRDGFDPGDFFYTMDEAAMDFGLTYNDNSIREGREYGSSIFSVVNKNGISGFTYTVPNIGLEDEVQSSQPPFGYKVAARIHTHGQSSRYNDDKYWDNEFSGMRDREDRPLSPQSRMKVTNGDIGIANELKIDSYLVTPNGSLKRYDHTSGKISTINTDMPSDEMELTRMNSISSKIETKTFNSEDLYKIQLKIINNEY